MGRREMMSKAAASSGGIGLMLGSITGRSGGSIRDNGDGFNDHDDGHINHSPTASADERFANALTVRRVARGNDDALACYTAGPHFRTCFSVSGGQVERTDSRVAEHKGQAAFLTALLQNGFNVLHQRVNFARGTGYGGLRKIEQKATFLGNEVGAPFDIQNVSAIAYPDPNDTEGEYDFTYEVSIAKDCNDNNEYYIDGYFEYQNVDGRTKDCSGPDRGIPPEDAVALYWSDDDWRRLDNTWTGPHVKLDKDFGDSDPEGIAAPYFEYPHWKQMQEEHDSCYEGDIGSYFGTKMKPAPGSERESRDIVMEYQHTADTCGVDSVFLGSSGVGINFSCTGGEIRWRKSHSFFESEPVC